MVYRWNTQQHVTDIYLDQIMSVFIMITAQWAFEPSESLANQISSTSYLNIWKEVELQRWLDWSSIITLTATITPLINRFV